MKNVPQAILMTTSDEQWISILNENKKITIREGERDYKEGLCVLFNEKINLCVCVDVTSVKRCKAENVPEEDYRVDGYASREEMLKDLRGYYPNLNWESDVTIVRWDNVRGKLVDEFRG